MIHPDKLSEKDGQISDKVKPGWTPPWQIVVKLAWHLIRFHGINRVERCGEKDGFLGAKWDCECGERIYEIGEFDKQEVR